MAPGDSSAAPASPRSSRLRAPFIVYAIVALFDVARALWPLQPEPADEVRHSGWYRPARLVGLAHTEAVQAYEVATYWTHRGIPLGPPTHVDPFVLVPLNVPARSGDRLVMVEFPDAPSASRPTVEGIEFTGLLGPIPADLMQVLNLESHLQPMRLQPGELPTAWPSGLFLCAVGVALRILTKAERAQLRHTTMSRLLYLAAQLPLVLLLSARLWLHPSTNSAGTWIAAAFTSAFCLVGALMTMKAQRPEVEAGRPLSDAEFEAAAAAHEELLSPPRE